jgi:hypothetical protein
MCHTVLEIAEHTSAEAVPKLHLHYFLLEGTVPSFVCVTVEDHRHP